MHGDDDRNVPFQQTVGLVQALRAQDVPFELIVFPDDVHDSLVYDRWLHAFGATEEFFGVALGFISRDHFDSSFLSCERGAIGEAGLEGEPAHRRVTAISAMRSENGSAIITQCEASKGSVK